MYPTHSNENFHETRPMLDDMSENCIGEKAIPRRWQVPQVKGRQFALDGLRGVAMFLVLLDHAGIGMDNRKGNGLHGFYGVSIFFVLSGFLISGILEKDVRRQREEKKSRYGYLGWFYMARAARLLPAQILMLTGIGFLTSKVPQFRDSSIDTVRSSLRVLTSTEDQSGVRTHFKHTWSLAVEEWSYIFLSLLVAWFPSNIQKRTKLLLILTISCWLFKIIFHFAEAGKGMPWYGRPYLGIPPLNVNWHFGAIPNMAKILLGSTIRLCPAPAILLKRNAITVYFVTVLLLFIVYPLDQYVKTYFGEAHRSLCFDILVSVLTSCVILTSLKGNLILEVPFLQFLGRISYSLYLRHFPLISIMRGSILSKIGAIQIAVLLAYFSTLLIEEPILTRFRQIRHKHHEVT